MELSELHFMVVECGNMPSYQLMRSVIMDDQRYEDLLNRSLFIKCSCDGINGGRLTIFWGLDGPRLRLRMRSCLL